MGFRPKLTPGTPFVLGVAGVTGLDDESGIVDLPVDRDVPLRVVAEKAILQLGWLLGLFLLILVFGFILVIPLYLASYMVLQGRERWAKATAISLLATAGMLGIFLFGLRQPWSSPYLAEPQKVGPGGDWWIVMCLLGQLGYNRLRFAPIAVSTRSQVATKGE